MSSSSTYGEKARGIPPPQHHQGWSEHWEGGSAPLIVQPPHEQGGGWWAPCSPLVPLGRCWPQRHKEKRPSQVHTAGRVHPSSKNTILWPEWFTIPASHLCATPTLCNIFKIQPKWNQGLSDHLSPIAARGINSPNIGNTAGKEFMPQGR